jgi:hypothetical protein
LNSISISVFSYPLTCVCSAAWKSKYGSNFPFFVICHFAC